MLDSELVTEIKPKDYWFDFKDEDDIKKLGKIEEYYSEQKESMPEKLQRSFPSKRRGLRQTNESSIS